MNSIEIVRKFIQTEEFDNAMLMQALRDYRKPRDAITKLLSSGNLLRIKKGLYTFGALYRRKPISKESLGNLIYGPSYISLEYALSYYALIPERVEEVTSMTSLRSKSFITPIGTFAYEHLHIDKMAVGVTLIISDKHHQFLIATPEKALADRIAFHKNLTTTEDIYSFVCEGLRIDEEDLAKFNLVLLTKIEEIYHNPAVNSLVQLVREITC